MNNFLVYSILATISVLAIIGCSLAYVYTQEEEDSGKAIDPALPNLQTPSPISGIYSNQADLISKTSLKPNFDSFNNSGAFYNEDLTEGFYFNGSSSITQSFKLDQPVIRSHFSANTFSDGIYYFITYGDDTSSVIETWVKDVSGIWVRVTKQKSMIDLAGTNGIQTWQSGEDQHLFIGSGNRTIFVFKKKVGLVTNTFEYSFPIWVDTNREFSVDILTGEIITSKQGTSGSTVLISVPYPWTGFDIGPEMDAGEQIWKDVSINSTGSLTLSAFASNEEIQLYKKIGINWDFIEKVPKLSGEPIGSMVTSYLWEKLAFSQDSTYIYNIDQDTGRVIVSSIDNFNPQQISVGGNVFSLATELMIGGNVLSIFDLT